MKKRKHKPIGKDEKYCSKCDRVLSLTEFHKQAHSPDGLHCRCRECRGCGTRRKNLTVAQRLKNNVQVAVNGCWNWTGEKNSSGYGRININGSKIVVHRAAYQEYIGDIPNGMFLCHKCDNPSCFNPDHLFLGTHKDNMLDMRLKGRAAKKLTEDDVRAILTSNNNDSEIAARFNINQSTVFEIKKRQIWAHVAIEA